jgi:hypothetical protein
MTSPSPVVGDWYRRPGGALFEVVAIDRVDSEDEADSEVTSGASWTDPLTSLDRSEASGYSEWPSPLDL